MGLNFKENDIVERKEDILEDTLFLNNRKHAEVRGILKYINNKDRLMLHTVMSILYKLRSKRIYMKGKMPERIKTDEYVIKETERIISRFYEDLKNNNYKHLKLFIEEPNKKDFIACLLGDQSKNRDILSDLLYKYYYERNTNYIEDKFYLETILNQNKAKEILALNPYMINQLMDYEQNPLTQEEKIIQEVMDYLNEAEWNYLLSDEIIGYVIKTLEKNNKNNNIISNKLLFIISNVYQESKERNDDFYGKLMYILENTKFDPETIINYINNDKKILIEIMKKFTEYNREIEEGRLEVLNNKPSAELAQKIYRKNP